jgi:hypothetical protein
MSTGGFARPVVVLPWQNVHAVSQAGYPAAAWHVAQDRP